MNFLTGPDATPTRPVLRWADDATIEFVPALRDDLLAAVALGADVTVCLGDVTRIDSAALQLLLATRASLAVNGRVLRIAEPSDAVRDAVRLSGLADLIAPTEAG